MTVSRQDDQFSPRVLDGSGRFQRDRWDHAGVGTVTADGRLWLGWVLTSWGSHQVPGEWQATDAGQWLRLEPHTGHNPLGRPLVRTCWVTMGGTDRPYLWLPRTETEVVKALPQLNDRRKFNVVRRLSPAAVWIAGLDLDAFPSGAR
jgi:hypothetical protein